MNTVAATSEQETSRVSPSSILTILICIAVIMALAGTAILLNPHPPWVEVLGQDLLRTNASSKIVAAATDAVIQKHQNWVVREDGKRTDPTYQGRAQVWNTGTSPAEIRVKVVRGETKITDKHGDTLSLRTISVTDTPTLIFIEYDDPDKKQEIVSELVNELIKKGAKLR